MTLDVAAFYGYLVARETIRLKKAAGEAPPWTDDPILQTYSFTNVKRLHDKTTQQFYHLLYKDHQDDDPRLVLLNAALARYYGTPAFIEAIGGWQTDFDYKKIIDIARDRLANKQQVFTGAYIITSGGRVGPKEITVAGFIRDLWDSAKSVVKVAHETQSWEKTAAAMRPIDGFGGTGFMAKEVLLDARLTNALWENGIPADMNDWSPIGPGTKRGAARLMGNTGRTRRGRQAKATPSDTLAVCQELFAARAAYWPKGWVELELTDMAFACCEVDKTYRVRLGEGRPRKRYHYVESVAA